MTLTLATTVNAATAATEHLSPSGAATNTRTPEGQAVPMFVPADQLYYWSFPWQDSERRAVEDLRAGRSRTFDNPTDAVRYLLGSDQP